MTHDLVPDVILLIETGAACSCQNGMRRLQCTKGPDQSLQIQNGPEKNLLNWPRQVLMVHLVYTWCTPGFHQAHLVKLHNGGSWPSSDLTSTWRFYVSSYWNLAMKPSTRKLLLCFCYCSQISDLTYNLQSHLCYYHLVLNLVNVITLFH